MCASRPPCFSFPSLAADVDDSGALDFEEFCQVMSFSELDVLRKLQQAAFRDERAEGTSIGAAHATKSYALHAFPAKPPSTRPTAHANKSDSSRLPGDHEK